MNMQIWGMALSVLGILVIADGVLGFVQKNTGTMRWLYMALGIVLVFRGAYLWWPFRKRRETAKSRHEND